MGPVSCSASFGVSPPGWFSLGVAIGIGIGIDSRRRTVPMSKLIAIPSMPIPIPTATPMESPPGIALARTHPALAWDFFTGSQNGSSSAGAAAAPRVRSHSSPFGQIERYSHHGHSTFGVGSNASSRRIRSHSATISRSFAAR